MRRLTLMFQREVAERIVAKPGNEDLWPPVGAGAAGAARAKILFDVAPRAFVPPPKVTSSIVRLDAACRAACLRRRRRFERVTAAAFGQRRKMLRQSLKTLGVDALALLAAAGIEPTARAEEIPVEGFVALARALVRTNG